MISYQEDPAFEEWLQTDYGKAMFKVPSTYVLRQILINRMERAFEEGVRIGRIRYNEQIVCKFKTLLP